MVKIQPILRFHRGRKNGFPVMCAIMNFQRTCLLCQKVIGVHIVRRMGQKYVVTMTATIVIKGRLQVIHAVNSGRQKMKNFLDNMQ